MVNIQKHVSYWRDSSHDDLEVARQLVEGGRYRHGLFFAHLGIEKILKAHVCKATGDMAPRIHQLVRLAEIAGVALSPGQIDQLSEISAYHLEGRYPGAELPSMSRAEATGSLKVAEELYQCLIERL